MGSLDLSIRRYSPLVHCHFCKFGCFSLGIRFTRLDLHWCGTYGDQRALSEAVLGDNGMTPDMCTSFCSQQNYKIAGIENGHECWCGNTIQNNQGIKVDDGECSTPCKGDQTLSQCGGAWRISLFTSFDEATRPSIFAGAVEGSSTTAAELASSTATDSASGSATSSASESSATAASDWTSSSSAPTSESGAPAPSDFGSSSVISGSETASSTAPDPAVTSAQPGSFTPVSPIGGSGTKYIWAGFVVGNAYHYTYDTWMNDIRLASDSGIDGFILDIGSAEWQPARVKDAYDAAAGSERNFKVRRRIHSMRVIHSANGAQMMLSFNTGALKCDDGSQYDLYRKYITDYLHHAAAAQIGDKQAVSASGGQDCTFGQGSTNDGWASVFASDYESVYFMPAFTGDPANLGELNFQANINWESAWPEGSDEINLARDYQLMGQLNMTGKKYIGTVSPLSASHLSSKVGGFRLIHGRCADSGQNSIWRSDDWLLGSRFEQMIAVRDNVDQIVLVVRVPIASTPANLN